MDEDTNELIAQIFTRIGVIMEDTSVVALTIGGQADEDRDAAIAVLVDAAARISALAGAVKVLAI